jgi:hypothetical protein
MHEIRDLSTSIARSPDDVHAFASDPRNLPRWAKGLARSAVTEQGDAWLVKAPFA